MTPRPLTFGEAIARYGFAEAARMLGETFRRKPTAATEPHRIGTDPPTPENDPIGRFRPKAGGE